MYDIKGKFFVQPQNESLIRDIKKMGYVLYTGHRGSGNWIFQHSVHIYLLLQVRVHGAGMLYTMNSHVIT
jgi:hypothetical protein